MRINLVSRDNGVGLTQDMALLESILTPAGHEVQRVDWRDPRPPAAHVGIHLELLNPAMIRHHRRNVGIFNLEWFQPKWRRYVHIYNQLWAKSGEASQVYRQWGLRNVHHTGFLGRDLHDPAVPRELSVVHLAGHSGHKNTDAVLSAWRADPGLPPLTVISHVPVDAPPHVRVLSRVSHESLVAELNRAAIHLCPSRAEGWGHYITEAASTGNLVITTDGSPMNEHITRQCGILINPMSVSRTHQAAAYTIAPGRIADAVKQAISLPAAQRERMGQAARQRLLERNQSFTTTALALLGRLR